MRLWNVDNGLVLAIFGRTLGHRNEVLSCDFRAFEHPRGVRPDGTREDVVIVARARWITRSRWTTDGYTDRLALGETFLSPKTKAKAKAKAKPPPGRSGKEDVRRVGDPLGTREEIDPRGEDAIDLPAAAAAAAAAPTKTSDPLASFADSGFPDGVHPDRAASPPTASTATSSSTASRTAT